MVRIRRDGRVHRHSEHWLAVHLAERRARVGLTADELLARAKEMLGATIIDTHARAGDATITIARDDALHTLELLRDRAPFQLNFLIDATAVDYLGRNPRYEVVYHLFSL